MTLGIDATLKVHVPILIHLNDTHCNFHVYMIFVSIVQISAEASNPSVTEFKQFMETLKSNIEKAENNRTVHHLRYVLLFTLSVLAWRFFFSKNLMQHRCYTSKHNFNIWNFVWVYNSKLSLKNLCRLFPTMYCIISSLLILLKEFLYVIMHLWKMRFVCWNTFCFLW